MSERPNAGTEETVERRDPSELERRPGKKKFLVLSSNNPREGQRRKAACGKTARAV
jgi:hypothetical protein